MSRPHRSRHARARHAGDAVRGVHAGSSRVAHRAGRGDAGGVRDAVRDEPAPPHHRRRRRRGSSAAWPPSAGVTTDSAGSSAAADRARAGRAVRRGDAALAGVRALDHRPAGPGRRASVRRGRRPGPPQRGAQPAPHGGHGVRADARARARRRHRRDRLVGEAEPRHDRRQHRGGRLHRHHDRVSSPSRSRPRTRSARCPASAPRPSCTGWTCRSTATTSTARRSTAR